MRRRRIALVAGVLAAVGGAGHLVTTVFMRRDAWSQIAAEGFLNTVTLDPPPDRLGLSEAFWLSPGSFGAPLLLLGALVTWLSWRGQRVPAWLGAGLLTWAVVLGLLGGFDAGTMILMLIGLLLAVGGWRRGTEATA